MNGQQVQALPQVAAQPAQQVAAAQAAQSRQLCFNTQQEQVCLRVTPLSQVAAGANGDVLQTQGFLSDFATGFRIGFGETANAVNAALSGNQAGFNQAISNLGTGLSGRLPAGY